MTFAAGTATKTEKLGTDQTGTTLYKLATYVTASRKLVGTDSWADNGYKFEILTDTQDATGHNVTWKLTWDTARISGTAATDVKVHVLAYNKGIPTCNSEGVTSGQLSINGTTYYAAPTYSGAKNSSVARTQTTSGEMTGFYQMDVVPYITEITRNGNYNTNRARSGAVSLLRGEGSNTIRGFNLTGGITQATDDTESTTYIKLGTAKDGTGTGIDKTAVTVNGSNSSLQIEQYEPPTWPS